MTFAEFSEVFAVLAMQLRAMDADEAMARSYYRVLEHESLPLLKLSAEKLASSAQWFPKTSEWLEAAKAIEVERAIAVGQTLQKRRWLGQPLCLACEDTGWVRNDDTNRVRRCDCVNLRRLEVQGHRLLPALPPGDAA
jgi:hypothetical protein